MGLILIFLKIVTNSIICIALIDFFCEEKLKEHSYGIIFNIFQRDFLLITMRDFPSQQDFQWFLMSNWPLTILRVELPKEKE